MPRPPSNDVQAEMIRAIKEDILPSMEGRISVRLDALTAQVTKTNGSVQDLKQRMHNVETEQFVTRQVQKKLAATKNSLWEKLVLPVAVGVILAIFGLVLHYSQ